MVTAINEYKYNGNLRHRERPLAFTMRHAHHTQKPQKRMDTTKIYNLIRRVLIKTMKRTERESEKLHGSSHPATLMWPQMLRKNSLH